MKNAMLVTAVATGLFTAMAQAAVVDFFSNPTTVNLLEKWNTTGTYGLATSTSPGHGTILDAEKYAGDGKGTNNWRFNPGNSTVIGRFTFDQPRTIDKLFIQWRNNTESPYNYAWYDQTGPIVSNSYYPSGAGSALPNNTSTDTFTARTSTWIELRSTPVSGSVTPNGTWEVRRIGAYLTTGQTLAIDGTYNVFYQENGAAPASTTGSGSAGLAAAWTDHTSGNGNPNGPGSMTWHFAQGYKFLGAYLTHLGDATSNALVNAKVDVSSDGTNWTNVFGPADVSTSYMLFTPNPGFVSWARVSWDPSGTGAGKEITEFQLFAMTPEPASLALLGLGAVALLRRKRS